VAQKFPLTRESLNELVDELALSAAFSEEQIKSTHRGFLQYNVKRHLLNAQEYIESLPYSIAALVCATKEICIALENIQKEIEPEESK